MGIFWGAIYYWQDIIWAAVIPWSYSVISFLGIGVFSRTGRFAFFRFSQLLITLVLPFMLTLTLGGLTASSGVMLWSLTSPLGALLFDKRQRALPWFVAFMVLLLFTVVLQPYLQPVEITAWVSNVLLLLNLAGVSFVAFILISYFIRKRDEAHVLLHKEREKSEGLLLNILPAKIAGELKAGQTTIAEHFDEVTIMFADLVGFTPLTAQLNPNKLLNVLNAVFSYMDDLVEKYKVEKIKTIGDCYMIAAGVPEPRPDHAMVVADLALEAMVHFRQHTFSGHQLDLRIGISSGPVVAGVIGRKKFMYDLWGDAVNLASRMESSGEAGQIRVSGSTCRLICKRFRCQSLGEQLIKGKGSLEVYQLLGKL